MVYCFFVFFGRQAVVVVVFFFFLEGRLFVKFMVGR